MTKNYTILVVPRSSKNEIIPLSEASLKITVTDPPHEGKANKRILALLCDYFHVGKTRVAIIKGATSRHKVVRLYPAQKTPR